MNQTPKKPQTRPLLKPVVLPKTCAPHKGFVILIATTALLLVISLMILSVALILGPSDLPQGDENNRKEDETKENGWGDGKLPAGNKNDLSGLPQGDENNQEEDETKENGWGDDKLPAGNKNDLSANGDDDPRPKIAITFDDGPHTERTLQIVDELEKYGYHATFFVLGNRLRGTGYDGRAALRYAAEHGNEIGIHGDSHEVYYDICTEEEYRYELAVTKQAILKVLPDAEVRLMRPIGGSITSERVKNCPYSVIKWDIDSEDWKYKSEENAEENIDRIVENVMSQVHEGGIILMHDIYGNTLEAAKIILQRLHEEGYNVVSVSELFGGSLKAGTLYSKAN